MKKLLLTLMFTSLLLGLANHCYLTADETDSENQTSPVSETLVQNTPQPKDIPQTPPKSQTAPEQKKADPAKASPAQATKTDTAVPDSCKVPTRKICVSDEVKQTKVVHGSRCKEYCVPTCFLLNWLPFHKKNADGCSSCDQGQCGNIRTRRVLVKYVVNDNPKKVCVVKEVPIETCRGEICVVPATEATRDLPKPAAASPNTTPAAIPGAPVIPPASGKQAKDEKASPPLSMPPVSELPTTPPVTGTVETSATPQLPEQPAPESPDK